MQFVINRILLSQLIAAILAAAIVGSIVSGYAAVACMAAAAAVLAGALIARHRAFTAHAGDGPAAVLKAFNRAMMLKWTVSLLLFMVAIMLFRGEPLALAIGFAVTILSAIPAGMVFVPKPE